ncbi:unnamed protein product, partial [Mesorhabditis belari]|uniref:Ig-like domain-containing protein n=1 Tax=Mesorhabditis belari TaxID=2138241 RepID=A0AAF3ES88_9BILA
MHWVFLILCAGLGRPVLGQLLQQLPSIEVKITENPFPLSPQLQQISWTVLGTKSTDVVFCVSNNPVNQLRFVCVDCLQRNITDMVSILSQAQDLSRDAGFPVIQLKNIPVNTNWTGATVLCQANYNGQPVDSSPAVVDVKFLRQPHVVDSNGQSPVQLQNNGNRFYVECQKDENGLCQGAGRRKTLRCNVQSNPPASTYRWLKNGVVMSGGGAEITIGTEMIGHSIQCSANNGLYIDNEMPISQAVQIEAYSAALVFQDNFGNLEKSGNMPGGRVQIDQPVNLQCGVRGNPRPIVYWRLRKMNGQVVDAPCPQGFDGQYQELGQQNRQGGQQMSNVVTLNAVCSFRVANYSFAGQYWCSACSHVSQGAPECSPSLDTPGSSSLTLQVQGPPMQSDAPPTIEQAPGSNNAVVTVHYCADPAPNPPRDIVFQVDQHDLQVSQSFENFRFDTFSQNSTVGNCYMARLGINRVTEADQYRTIFLKVQNMKGARQIPVPLESLLGGGSTSSGKISGAWIAFIVLLALCVVLAALITICVKKQMFCFNRTKDEDDLYTHTKPKNLAPNMHNSFDEPRLFAPSPAEVSEAAGYGVYLSREAVV